MSLPGRHAFLRLLLDEGIDHLFGNPGTTELAIMEAVGEVSELRYVLGLQESIVLGMADGFARASGRLAACSLHVAPGLGNAMGALYNAKFSGTPLIVTAGQYEQGHGLTEPLLYDDLPTIARPLVKWAAEVTRADDLPRMLRRAATVALAPPTGPVFLSLPGDMLDATVTAPLGAPTRVLLDTRPSEAALADLAGTLLRARRPAIIAGHELATRDAFAQAGALATLLGAEVFQHTVPYSAQFLSEHPLHMGTLSRSQKQVRALLEPFDLIVCLGCDLLKMSVGSPVDPLPPAVPVVHVSERPWELGKNYPTAMAIASNVRATLDALLPLVRVAQTADGREQAQRRARDIEARNWTVQRARARQEVLAAAEKAPIDPRLVMMTIADRLPERAIVVEEALTSSVSLPQFLRMRDAHSLYGLASGGLGFGMPGAVGAALAHPDRRVVAVIGDGSAMYGIQALWTAAHLKLPIAYVITNNRGYRILKDRLVSYRKTDRFVGMDIRDPDIDYVTLAASMGVPGRRVVDPADLVPALDEAFASPTPRLVEVLV